jgi:hypothetical protein
MQPRPFFLATCRRSASMAIAACTGLIDQSGAALIGPRPLRAMR